MSRRASGILKCHALLLMSFAGSAALAFGLAKIARGAATSPPRGVEIVQDGGYPELRVDGEPFFIHSAAFFYDRIPRDLWEKSLERHRDLGINTIDLYIPWNWHEPRPGEFDFDGHTNRRRDLRGLLELIAEKGFKLIARPGPVILNEWRNGGYPDWLLGRPEYKMDPADVLEGRYPPLSNLNASDAEAAARGWLANPTHMAQARQWLAAVARELAPYSAHRTLRLPATAEEKPLKGGETEKEISGPLLFLQLGDDLAEGRTNSVGPAFWLYLDELRGMLEAGGLDAPVFINPTDMRVAAAGSRLKRPIGVMGQWYFSPRPKLESGERSLTAEDLSTLEFYVEELKTQPAFPPALIEYQAGWYCPADDSSPEASPVANTLLSSRLLLAQGLHGFSYYPAQDTIFPAGYAVPWANRYYRWDAALDPDTNSLPRARALERNGRLVAEWGSFLAASHKRADFGLVDPLGSYPQEMLSPKDVLQVSGRVMQVERIALLAGLSSELLDPEDQPVEQLLRDSVVLLPVFAPDKPEFTLSVPAQQALVEYVRRGGTLIYFPRRPGGDALAPMFQGPAAPSTNPASAVTKTWRFGAGRVMESSKDFYSWAVVQESLGENRRHAEAPWAIGALREFLTAAGVRPVLAGPKPLAGPLGNLVITELVSNAESGPLGERKGGSGLLSVTNLSPDQTVEASLEILSPRAGQREGKDDAYLSLSVVVPARESLLLPLEHSLCSAPRPREHCSDAVVSAGAELLGAARDGKSLELTFYAPARAEVDLRLAQKPSHVTLEENSPEAHWTSVSRLLEVRLLRGASPSFRRVLKLRLPYTPSVPEEPAKSVSPAYEFEFANTVRLPIADNVSLATQPPLFVLDTDRTGNLLVTGRTRGGGGRSIDFKIDGPIHGSGSLDLDAKNPGLSKIYLQPARGAETASPGPDGLLHGRIAVHSGHDRHSLPILFAVVDPKRVTPYQFDFDRDGWNEWVLESSSLRLVVSPEAGGRALALVDKSTGMNLSTSVGMLRDQFTYAPNSPPTRPERARGRYGLFNRTYRAEWIEQGARPALRLSYDAPDVYPAGVSIQKTATLVEPATLQVDYRVQLHPRPPLPDSASRPAPASAQPQQAFLAVSSVPAVSRGENSTSFCWNALASSPGAKPASSSAPARVELHCEPFVPGRGALDVPAGVTWMEMRTPGRPGLVVNWRSASMTIQMEHFSALLELRFAPLEPGAAPGQYRITFRASAEFQSPAP